MSVCIGLNGGKKRRKAKGCKPGGERKWIKQDTRRHQPPEPVPLLYTTPLYLLAILNQIMFFIQIINCNRGTWQGFAKKRFCFQPLQPDSGRGEERGRRTWCITGYLQSGVLRTAWRDRHKEFFFNKLWPISFLTTNHKCLSNRSLDNLLCWLLNLKISLSFFLLLPALSSKARPEKNTGIEKKHTLSPEYGLTWFRVFIF